MDALLFNVTTAALLVVLFLGGRTAVGAETVPQRRVPWAAVALTAVALAGVVLQLVWAGAMDALDSDPGKAGWWRPITSVFMQNGGVGGTAWNIGTLAAVAALAEWFWGAPLMLALFAAGALLPDLVDRLLGMASDSADPRNFAGSSGATYFLGATTAAVLLLRGRTPRERLLALAGPALGLAMWFAQDNAHGLVAVDGFLLGVVVWLLARPVLRPERDLRQPPRITVGALTTLLRRGGTTAK
ncbi:hypothetical protein [Streptoalloteichus hindustanus]|uniref:Rhomboid family protein n=1 Tax=Streptoalloteichus hindustanus TaxID=2017 RepID=A0A1M5IA23_STRHI|nr:hypothetical protein [Streptoalloteichus hindustanus]SHG25248.1 hypothetical protein SAMN05444320_107194 [Streptoalloteichus hindustanus]